jgi:RimJ/RimL family protein N-acetyltransferase
VTTISDGVITLRPPRDDDIDTIHAACQDPEIQRWTAVPSPYHREDAVSYVQRAAAERESGRTASFVCVDDEGRMLGSFAVMEMDKAPGYGEIGYWVAAEARRRSVASRAVALLRDWAAAELGLRLIELIIDSDNAPSRRVAERTGFRETGELRPAPRTENPGPPNHAVYAWRSTWSPTPAKTPSATPASLRRGNRA